MPINVAKIESDISMKVPCFQRFKLSSQNKDSSIRGTTFTSTGGHICYRALRAEAVVAVDVKICPFYLEVVRSKEDCHAYENMECAA